MSQNICSIEGCDRPFVARGWCMTHYRRWKRHGNTEVGKSTNPLGFFADVVLGFSGDDCLLWPFTKDSHGYGRMWFNGKRQLVHRRVCRLEHGEAPTLRHIAVHSCGNGHLGCVNRKHLRWATHAENTADAIAHGTTARGERHGSSRLTASEVIQIREMSGAESYRSIANRFGISRGMVSHIVRRRAWKWLENSKPANGVQP